MVHNLDVGEFKQALLDLQHQLDLLLDDIADLQAAAQSPSPSLLKICGHLEILINETETVLGGPNRVGPGGHGGWIH